MVQEHYNSRKRILERDRRSKRVYRKRSIRSSRRVGKRLEKRRKSDTVEGKDLCSRLGYALQRNHY